MYLQVCNWGILFVQSVLEIHKVMIKKLVSERRHPFSNVPGLYFSVNLNWKFQLPVQTLPKTAERFIYPFYTKVFLESPIDHLQRVYCWALATSSTKIRDIVAQPVLASALSWPVAHFPTQNPTRTFPLWMLLQWPSIWRWRWRLWLLPVCM